jgi:hypothetical protein
MRSAASLAVGAAAAAAVVSAGHVAVPISRDSLKLDQYVKITTRDDDSAVPLEALNNITGGGYYSEFSIGTPPQKLSFHLDTGSSDTWVNSVDADLCTNERLQSNIEYCSATFDPEDSSSYELVDRNGFNITYLDGRNIAGDYFNDTVTLGDIKIENQQLGLATSSVRGTGLMGLGYKANVAASTEYPTILDNMVSQGVISTHAFSMYLNDIKSEAGTILFGAIDSKKYIGDLAILPILSGASTEGGPEETPHYAVRLDNFTVNVPDGADAVRAPMSSRAAAILDSGSTISILPDTAVDPIFEHFNVRSIQGSLSHFADCALADDDDDYSFDFGFDGKTIRVPLREMLINPFSDLEQAAIKRTPDYEDYFSGFDSVCLFGLTRSSEFSISDRNFVLLGDTFLRSAYVVYDQVNNEVGIAQANLRSTDEDIHEFTDDSRIPKVKGVDQQDSFDASKPNDNAGSGSGSGSDSGDGNGNSSDSGNGNGDSNGNGNADGNSNGNGNGDGGNGGNGDEGAAGRFSPSMLATIGLTFVVGFSLF